MVIHERYGLIVPPRDSAAIVSAASMLINDNRLCQRLSDNISRDYLEGEKSWKKIVHDLVSYYNHIIE